MKIYSLHALILKRTKKKINSIINLLLENDVYKRKTITNILKVYKLHQNTTFIFIL